MPLFLQVKLLHFLQTKKITRVGGITELSVDTRVIAASNKRLDKEVKKGTFRQDLYYRLNVIPIHIPSLEERRDDIVEMAEYFLDFYNNKYEKEINLTEEIKEFITTTKWPGNVRELENYIERLVITNDINLCINLSKDDMLLNNDHKFSIRRIPNEKERIIALYEKHRSSYKVAEELGVSQSTAYRKIRKYMNDSK